MKWTFFIDLLKGPENAHWDLGRILALLSALSMLAGELWNVLLGLPLELGPAGFGGGLAAVLGGAAALIYAKDRARAENIVSKAVNTTANTESRQQIAGTNGVENGTEAEPTMVQVVNKPADPVPTTEKGVKK